MSNKRRALAMVATTVCISGILAVSLALFAVGARRGQIAPAHDREPAGQFSRDRFESLMRTVSEGWNRGDARLAVSCFAEHAIYSGPPSRGHRGRKALYDFFGGASGRERPMHMTWHTLVFDPVQQIGVGEYTFQYEKQTQALLSSRFRMA